MKIYCKNCEIVSEHRQKLGGNICNVCDHINSTIFLKRCEDGLVKIGDRVNWIQWNSDLTYRDLADGPEIGASLVIDLASITWTWMTTQITEIIEDRLDGEVRFINFKTQNSEYHLWITKI